MKLAFAESLRNLPWNGMTPNSVMPIELYVALLSGADRDDHRAIETQFGSSKCRP
jgi:hypothetical protein